MSESSRIRITLDIDLDADALQGEMAAGEGPPRPFTGWIALAHALESALTGADGRGAVPDTATRL